MSSAARAPDPTQTDTQRPIVHLSTQRALRGGERQLRFLHEGLLAHDVPSAVLCRHPSVFGKLPHTHAIAWRGLADPLGLRSFWQQCQLLRPRLLHAHDAHAFTLSTWLTARTSTPVVYTRRVLFPIRPHLWNRIQYERAAALVGISRAVEATLRGIVPAGNIHCIPSGVRGAPPSADERYEARKRLAVDERTVVIGSVAHFTPEKQPELLLQLAAHLGQVRKNVVVALIGPLPEELEARARDMQNVIATGQVARALDYYPAFDLYVSTSTSEGLGTALLDAVVRDIPAFAVDSGGTRDIFGDLPRLAATGDAYDFIRLMEQVLDAPGDAIDDTRKLGKEARTRFSVEAMVNAYLQLYAQVDTARPTAIAKV